MTRLFVVLVALAAGVVLGLVVAARRDRARTRHLRVWAEKCPLHRGMAP